MMDEEVETEAAFEDKQEAVYKEIGQRHWRQIEEEVEAAIKQANSPYGDDVEWSAALDIIYEVIVNDSGAKRKQVEG